MALTLKGPHTIDELEPVLDRVMTWINDRDVVKNLANFNHVFTRDEEREWLGKTLTSPVDRVYSVEDDGKYLGQVGIHQIYWPARHGRVSTIILPAYQHRGLGTTANLLLMERGFGELGLNKLWGVAWADNPRTNALFRKLGYHHAGTLRDEYVIGTDHGIVYHDMERYEMLKRDYERLKGEGYFQALVEPQDSRL